MRKFQYKFVNPADRIREALDRTRLTPYALAKNSGVSQSIVSMILTGKRELSYKIASKLAAALNCSPTWLLTGEGDFEAKTTAAPSETDDDFESEALPIYGNLPGWREAEKEARKQLPQLPNWVWARARKSCGVTVFDGGVTPENVLKIAAIIYESTTQTTALTCGFAQ